MTDLSTTYLGLKLSSPLVPSASPLSKNVDTIKRMEDAGAAAVVMYSLFEEQINQESHELDYYLTHGAESYAEAMHYFPEPKEFTLTPEQYLDHIRKAKESVRIPIIGSLNGVSTGGWIKYAQKIEQAGADALELNIYFIPTDPLLSSIDIEYNLLDLVNDVRRSVKIPLAVKLSPFFTNLTNVVRRLDETGVNGLVLFNRFYQPDIDLDSLDVTPRVTLSSPFSPNAMRLPLRWIAILYGRLKADLAATSGIHNAQDVLKMIMAGATVTMMASELLSNGVDRLNVIRQDMLQWMEEHEYDSVTQMRGSMSQQSVKFPAAFERAHYMRAITNYEVPWK
ncbi:MAG: dihydroorotate dehydrogenase-like protein [Chloroflexi bacterium]|nr:dihydroorotate dehydrogenase-like protein [Chloroflexota bacterium]